MKTVFLGGTVNGSTWRDQLIERVNNADMFNPVVPDWNDEAYQRELVARETSDYVLYVITPKMTGVYSIAEVVDDSNKRPEKTLFYIIDNDEGDTFTPHQIKALKSTGKMVEKNGAKWFDSFDSLVYFLNA